MGWTGSWRQRLGVAALALLPATPVPAQTAPAPPAGVACSRAEFEAVVSEAAEKLRGLTQQKSPQFQGKLRSLKDKRGWSHDQFMTEGARFVADDKIAGYEEKSGQLLARLNGAGGDVVAAGTDCARLAELQATMASLVDLQSEKWTYMFGLVDAELAK